MRHRVYGKHLGRSTEQRGRLFKNLIRSLILHRQIETTQPKAKAVKGLIDRIITQAKSKTTRQLVASYFNEESLVEELNKEILPKLQGRTSGYTTYERLGKRLGDGAMMVRVSFLLEEPKEKASTSDKEKPKKIAARSAK